MKTPEQIKILLACEESQAVCIEFRKLGFQAFSCDILPCSGNHPEWHIQDDVMNVLRHDIIDPFRCEWDCVIAFPPCTDLAVSGARHFEQKRKDGRQRKSIMFFEFFTHLKNRFVAIENPIGIMSNLYRKPDQVIQPYYFGDEFQKTTCLWLKDLPKLYHNSEPNLFDYDKTHVSPGEMHIGKRKDGTEYRMAKWYNDARPGDHGHKRSKTFPGIAKAMATQWGEYILNYL